MKFKFKHISNHHIMDEMIYLYVSDQMYYLKSDIDKIDVDSFVLFLEEFLPLHSNPLDLMDRFKERGYEKEISIFFKPILRKLKIKDL